SRTGTVTDPRCPLDAARSADPPRPAPRPAGARMGLMWRARISGIFARKVLLLLTALAVVLGVTFVSGTYVLTDTLHASLSEVFQQYASGSDLVVAAKREVGDRTT